MLENVLLNELRGNVVSTAIALAVTFIAFFLVDFFYTRKIDSVRQKRQFRVRAFYIAGFVFIFFMARIWVEGFTHLLAVLGLVSAALVVTNKETIMNFVGWLVINWRGLFSEDDLIQIQEYKGYVKSFGMLYFTLAEISSGRNNRVSGKLIRIPNGMIANNPLVNFSQTSHLLEQSLSIVLVESVAPDTASKALIELINNILSAHYKGKKEYSMEHLKRHHHYLHNKMNLETSVRFKPKLDKPTGIEYTAYYYCFSQDCEMLEQKIWLAILAEAKQNKDIKIAYTT